MATVAFWHHLGKLLHHPVFHFPTQIVLRDGSYGLPFATLSRYMKITHMGVLPCRHQNTFTPWSHYTSFSLYLIRGFAAL